MACEHQNHPKQVTRGIVVKGKRLEPIKQVGCGKSTSIVLQERGIVMAWGKNESHKPKHDDFKRYSMPYQLSYDLEIVSISMGFDHFLMVDNKGQLWGMGENTHGCLGTTDIKHRTIPQLNNFFESKRIIDMACGDKFSVVIAESFEFTGK
jgi:alpha-tubulin suppressor-like RCC1 family protein